jgi:hypothetical protein
MEPVPEKRITRLTGMAEDRIAGGTLGPNSSRCSCRAVQICKAPAKPGVVPGDVLGASNHLVAAPLCELGPAMRDQILGVIGGHLDGAIGLDVEMPPRKALTAYLDGAGLRDDPKGPLFRTIGRGTGQLTRTVLPQANAYAMTRRRAAAAGIETKLGNHSFRATGITAYLKNGGTLEKAAAMANHASTRTTQLYDRRREELSLDEVERIVI